MATLEESVKVRKSCCGSVTLDVSGILADPGLFRTACEDIYQMYEREVFDIIVTTKLSGTVFAASLACRMGKGLVILSCVSDKDGYQTADVKGAHSDLTVGMADGIVTEGMKAVIVVDEITRGRDIRAAIDLLERQGAKVIKVSGFVEDCEENARKKVLRGYPVDSRLFTEDF